MPATTKRRSTLSRRDREMLAYNVLPMYIRQMSEDIAAIRTAADGGGNSFITADAARRMAAQFEQQMQSAEEMISKLVGDDSNEEDAA